MCDGLPGDDEIAYIQNPARITGPLKDAQLLQQDLLAFQSAPCLICQARTRQQIEADRLILAVNDEAAERITRFVPRCPDDLPPLKGEASDQQGVWANEFIDLFQGQGSTQAERLADALRRASAIMVSLDRMCGSVRREAPYMLPSRFGEVAR